MNRWLLFLLNSVLAVLFVGIPAVLAARATVLLTTSWAMVRLWLPFGVPGFLAGVVLPTILGVLLAASLGLATGVHLSVVLGRSLVGPRTLRRWLFAQTRLPLYRRLVERALASAR
jgi:hypothetical protein